MTSTQIVELLTDTFTKNGIHPHEAACAMARLLGRMCAEKVNRESFRQRLNIEPLAWVWSELRGSFEERAKEVG